METVADAAATDGEGKGEVVNEAPSQSCALKSQERQIFVLSHAGKPIYTRYGDEQRLAPLMGIIQAIVSFSQSTRGETDDCIRSITAGKRKFVFLLRNELYLVAVTTTGEPEPFLQLQLEYLYHQIVFLLTAGRIQAKFSSNASYDLRDLLGATHNVLAGIVDMPAPANEMAGCMVSSSVACLPLLTERRDDIGKAIVSACSTTSHMLYGILLCGTRLVTLVQPKDPKLQLHASDLLLVINFISTQPSLRRVESWTPVCLPRFNDRGFLYSYVGYLDPQNSICLLLISANEDPEQFHACCQSRAEIQRVMEERGHLPAIAEASNEQRKAITRYSNGAMAFHFLYKYNPAAQGTGGGAPASSSVVPQCTSSAFFFPYIDDEAKQRVWNQYVTAILQLRYGGRTQWNHMADSTDKAAKRGNGDGAHKGPSCVMDVFEAPAEHSLVYQINETDCILVNVGPDFELFALLSAATELSDIVHSCNRLIRSIKREESWLFMTHGVHW